MNNSPKTFSTNHWEIGKMNWHKIIETRQVSQDELHQLESYMAQHPYSALLQTLVAKGYIIHEPGKSQEQLKHAAIRVKERKKLHDFLYTEKDVVELIEDSNENQSLDTSREIIDSKTEDESQEEKIQVDKELESNQKIAEFDRQLAAAALSTGIALKLLEEEPELDANAKAENESSASETEKSEQLPESITPPSTPHQKMNFTSWMESLRDESDNEVKEVVVPAVHKEHLQETMQIIDHFIENEESLVPKRAEFYSPTKAAKNSLADNDEIVTETLAKIYAEQGSILKAISTYEKLSLRHPEKSAYFAALIENLKKEI